MRVYKLAFSFLLICQYAHAQKPIVEATCRAQTIESYTDAMDQGAHAIHLVLQYSNANFKVASGQKLSDAIKAIEWHTKSYTRYEVKYILYISTSKEYKFESKSLFEMVDSYIPMDRVTIRSSDLNILKYWGKNYPEVKLAIIDNPKQSIATNLANLGIKPNDYCINKSVLTALKVKSIQKRKIDVTSFTVNDTTSMRQMMEWQVDRIVTDSLHLSKLLFLNREVKDGTN